MMHSWNNHSYNYFYYPYYGYQRQMLPPFYFGPPPFQSAPSTSVKVQEIEQRENFHEKTFKQPELGLENKKLEKQMMKKTHNKPKEKLNQNIDVDQEYCGRRQTPQRNTLSNTIKYFLRYVLLKPQEAIIEIENISKQCGLSCTGEEFMDIFKSEFQGRLNYISKECIESIWLKRQNWKKETNVQLKNQFCTIFRILFLKYFDNLIFGERLAERKKKKKYELVHKRHIRAFIKELENKYKRRPSNCKEEVKIP